MFYGLCGGGAGATAGGSLEHLGKKNKYPGFSEVSHAKYRYFAYSLPFLRHVPLLWEGPQWEAVFTKYRVLVTQHHIQGVLEITNYVYSTQEKDRWLVSGPRVLPPSVFRNTSTKLASIFLPIGNTGSALQIHAHASNSSLKSCWCETRLVQEAELNPETGQLLLKSHVTPLLPTAKEEIAASLY